MVFSRLKTIYSGVEFWENGAKNSPNFAIYHSDWSKIKENRIEMKVWKTYGRPIFDENRRFPLIFADFFWTENSQKTARFITLINQTKANLVK